EGSIEADLWIDTGDDGKGYGLGDQCQGHDEARQQVTTNVAEPLRPVAVDRHRNVRPSSRRVIPPSGLRSRSSVVRRIGGRKSHPATASGSLCSFVPYPRHAQTATFPAL